MQQVFEFVNAVLRGSVATCERRLAIRTYRIVPLTPQTGVIEWVDGTMPLGSFLHASTTGAHARYRPQDLPHAQVVHRHFITASLYHIIILSYYHISLHYIMLSDLYFGFSCYF
jgi:hypothetical protein